MWSQNSGSSDVFLVTYYCIFVSHPDLDQLFGLFLSVHRGADERMGVRERVTVENDHGREHVWTSKCLRILSGALLCPPTPCQLGNV